MAGDTGATPDITMLQTPETPGDSLPHSAEALFLRVADVRIAVNQAYEVPAITETPSLEKHTETDVTPIHEPATNVIPIESARNRTLFSARDPRSLYSGAKIVGSEFDGLRSGFIDNVAA